MRCEKNFIGRRSTFHIYDIFPTTAILPFIFSEYTACIHDAMICTAETPASPTMKGRSQAASRPVSSLSIKTREKPDRIIPVIELMSVVMVTKATAADAPFRRAFANSAMLFGLPPGTKASDGSNIRHTPV